MAASRGAGRKMGKRGGSPGRGIPLVDAVIARMRAGTSDLDEPAVPEPVPANALATLEVAPGVRAPPSLLRWLEFDGDWIGGHGWFDDASAPVFSPKPIHELVSEHLHGEAFAPCFRNLPKTLGTDLALPLDVGSESMRLLLCGHPDEHGELPVLYAEIDGAPRLGVEAPGFDVWLAEQDGTVSDARAQYAEERAAVGRRVFGDGCPPGDPSVEPRPDDDIDDAPAKAPPAPAPPAKKNKPAGAFAVPKGITEEKLGKALADALSPGSGKEERVAPYLAAAKERFPGGATWWREPLSSASTFDRADVVRELLACGMHPTAKVHNDPALHWAASWGAARTIRALLDAGAPVDEPRVDPTSMADGKTALLEACRTKGVEVARELLSRGANPTLADARGNTPILAACHIFDDDPASAFDKTAELARLLADAGADLDAAGGGLGLSPMLHAIAQDNEPLARALLERGAAATPEALGAAWLAARPAIFDRLAAKAPRRDVRLEGGYTLDEVTDPSGLLPARLDVRVQCREAPQALLVRLCGVDTKQGKGAADVGERLLRNLASLAEGGFLGSDAFAPGAGAGRYDAGEGARGPEEPTSFLVNEGIVTLAGVSPAGLALWLRSTIRYPSYQLVALKLVGEAPLDGSSSSFDGARAAACMRDLANEPLRPWPDATVPWIEKKSAAQGVKVRWKKEAPAAVRDAFVAALKVATHLLLPSAVRDLRARPAMFRAGFLDTTKAKTEDDVTEIAWKPLLGMGTANPVAPELVRAIFVNGLSKVGEHVVEATWTYGVGG